MRRSVVATRRPTDEILERCRRLEGGGLRTFADEQPLVWQRSWDSWVEDADGQTYLDLYAGFAVANIGYNHPKVVEAVRHQAGTLMHCPSAHASEVRAEFLEALSAIAPPDLTRILPAVTGAMANEIALAITRTRSRGEIVTFTGSYFGRAAGVVGLAGRDRYRASLDVDAAGYFLPYPYPLRMGDEATDLVMNELELLTESLEHSDSISAVILEPIQGNGGVLIPPDDFLPRLRSFCDRHSALMIVDEIQSGAGRTGRMWAVEHIGVTPDLMTVGKGIGGGLAMAAVLGREHLMTWAPDTYTSTFLTNNLNMAAAIAAIGVLRHQDLPARSALLGRSALEQLTAQAESIEGVAEIRGRGLWVGVELTDRHGEPDRARATAVQLLARTRGVLVGKGGHDDNVIKISPPLIIAEEELARGLETITACLGEVGVTP